MSAWRTHNFLNLFFCTILLLLSPCIVFSEEAHITAINQESYFPTVLKAIKKADHSITIVMPYIQKTKENGPVSWLLNALVSARERNCVINVYLDYSSGKDILPGGFLYEVYQFLKKAEIEVFFDYPNIHLNNRLVIIDERIIIGGSALWTDAMDKNQETCFYIESMTMGSFLSQEIKSLPTIAETAGERSENFAYIPVSFIKGGTLKQITQKQDEASLDAYLALVRDFDGQKVDWSYVKLADAMGLSKRMKASQKKKKIHDTLKKLHSKYNLIKIKVQKHKRLNIQITQTPGELTILLPKTYWVYRWHKTLKFHAKIFLLINLQQISFSKTQFDWTSSMKGLYETYGVSYWIMENGFIDLCKENVMQFGEIRSDIKNAKNSIIQFHYNGFYDKEDFHKKLAVLAEKNGEKNTFMARNFAALIYKKYDIAAIDYISLSLKAYGDEAVKETFNSILQSKSISNKRRLEFLKRYLRPTK